MPRLRTLEICGFRSFVKPQSLSFEANLAFVWASNSQGKTSIAEAVEFLFTGTTSRRELLGGAKAEFDSSLRNVHLDKSDPVWVKAEIEDDSGTKHDVCRTLVSDYTADQQCVSELTTDGQPASDLSALGIALLDPPLRAPILLQHSLRFALSAKPSDRADYFKGLLGVQDLDLLGELVSAQAAKLQSVPGEVILKLRRLSSLDGLSSLAADIESSDLSATEVEKHLGTAVATALGGIGEEVDPAEGLTGQSARLHEALESRRERTFPVNDYSVGADVPELLDQPFAELRAYSELGKEVDTEVESLRSVFEAVLAIPAVAHGDHALDCPVCESRQALTTERVAAMRAQVAESKDLRRSQAVARNELEACLAGLTALEGASSRLLPAATGLEESVVSGRESVVEDLIGSIDLHRSALQTVTPLAEVKAEIDQALKDLRAAFDEAKKAIARAEAVDVKNLTGLVTAAQNAIKAALAPRLSCVDAMEALLTPIRESVDKRQGLSQWRELVELAGSAQTLCAALKDARAIANVRKELQEAQRQIDTAKLQVFNDKFQGMSDEITRWWQLLRPDEPVHFEAVRPRGAGKRFVSLKARLRPQLGAAGVERDALGVFSDSQLNALGFAAFLARTKLQESPLIILDDPLQAGDADHRLTFVAYVLQELLDAGVQVIVLSFDDMTQKLLHNRYESLPIDGFVVTLEHPSTGSVVAKTSDTADALLQQASINLGSDHVAVRRAGAQAIRVAAERLAKEILVKERTAKGDTCSLEDYEGQTLGRLIVEITPYLTDAADPGKWKTVNISTSPGLHDSSLPTRTDLKVAHGDLRKFYNTYIKS